MKKILYFLLLWYSGFYNKVAKGDYIFEVKATDANGLWSKEITRFEIHRLPKSMPSPARCRRHR